jgi:hypothetical protein
MPNIRSGLAGVKAPPREIVLQIMAELYANGAVALAQSRSYFLAVLLSEESIFHLIRVYQNHLTGLTLYDLLDTHDYIKLTCSGCVERHTRDMFSHNMLAHSYAGRTSTLS